MASKIILGSLLLFLNLVALLLGEICPDKCFNASTIVLLITSVLILWSNLDKGFFCPSSLFYISIFIFISARPISALFLDKNIVEAGNSESLLTIYSVNMYISFFLLAFYWFSIFISQYINENSFKPIYQLKLYPKNNFVKRVMFLTGILFGVGFLYKSVEAAFVMTSSSNYFEFAENSKNYFLLFFLSKYALFITFMFSKKSSEKIIVVLFIFIFSIGFILIGLRGYTIAYLFSFLVVLSWYKEISIRYIVVLVIALPLIGGLVLEYRLGFSIFESFIDMFAGFFHQQGASYELLYGTFSFPIELVNCISLNSYLMDSSQFGSCVDNVRGVDFEAGGFGTSSLAELWYLKWMAVPIIILIFLIVSVTDILHSRIKKNDQDGAIVPLFIVMLIPSIVYFARSTATELVVKFVMSFLAMLILTYILKLMVKQRS